MEGVSQSLPFMSLEAELFTTEPSTQTLALGSHQVFRFENVTPAHTFVSIVKFCTPAIPVQLISRDSFSELLATFLLDQVDEFGLPDDPGPIDRIHVRSATFPAPWKFETIVLVPPSIAQRFVHKSEALQNATWWALPAFAPEFNDGGPRSVIPPSTRQERWLEGECHRLESPVQDRADMGLKRRNM